MASTATATMGPTRRPILDLDAGTTLPRAIPIAGAVLLIAGIALLLAVQPGTGSQAAGEAVPRIAPQVITMPALRPTWPLYPPTAQPSWPVGPAASLVNLTGVLAPDADVIGQ